MLQAFRTHRKHLIPSLLFFAFSLVVTHPLWRHPATVIASYGDPLLNAWILDWVHYALFHQIGDFFQANVFWPRADALAYGEHLLAPALLVLPARLFTSSAVALHNISCTQAYFFSALACYALAYYYFRSVPTATLAGLFYGFGQYRLSQYGHIQLIHGEFLPLMVLAFEKALRSDKRGWLYLLGASAWGQWMTSWYWTVFSFWALVPFFIWRISACARGARRKPMMRRASRVLIALSVAAVAAIPLVWPYVDLKMRNALHRPAETLVIESARPGDYLTPHNRSLIAGEARESVSPERTLFVGLLPLVGCALGWVLGGRRRGRFPMRVWFAILVMLWVFSFGVYLEIAGRNIPMPYLLVNHYFPFASGIRVSARWMLPALLPLALIAARGWWLAVERIHPKGGHQIAFGVVIALCVVESIPQRIAVEPVFDEPFSVHAWLAEQPFPTPVVEVPIAARNDNRHMLYATWHHQPIVNGSNGFYPPDHIAFLARIGEWPAPEAEEALREMGVEYVIVDTRTNQARPNRAADFEFGEHWVYRVR